MTTGLCGHSEHSIWKETEGVDSQGNQIGITKCRWGKSNRSVTKPSCDSPKTCQAWAECDAEKFCHPFEYTVRENNKNERLLIYVFAGFGAIIFGLIPVFIYGFAKVAGQENLENICINVGANLAVVFTLGGGVALLLLSYFTGKARREVCNATKEEFTALFEKCSSEKLDDCGAAMQSDISSYCQVGNGLLGSSIAQICAILCASFSLYKSK